VTASVKFMARSSYLLMSVYIISLNSQMSGSTYWKLSNYKLQITPESSGHERTIWLI